MTATDAYHELCAYTLSVGDAEFMHQHVVDAFAAQDARADDRPIRLTFALVGLYLALEKSFTGREIQFAHMRLAKKRRDWPRFELPSDRGSLTAADALAAPPEHRRDAIFDWRLDVWKTFSMHRDAIKTLLSEGEVVG